MKGDPSSAPTLPDLVRFDVGRPPFAEASRAPAWVEGRVTGGYRALERVAQGGMGIIHRAEQLATGKLVALKTLVPELWSDPIARARLLAEGATTMTCRHGNVVRVLEVGRSVEGEPFVAMELLEGPTLAQDLKARGPMPASRAVRIGRQILRALEAVHANGIVHRDVKTENFVLAKRGAACERIKLIDFGIARVLPRPGRVAVPEFGERAVVGTPRFMSPEQALGETGVDARADVYSFGVVLYQMLSGCLPHATTSLRPLELTTSLLTRPPVPLRERRADVPRGLATIVMRALARERDARWPSASAMRLALDAWSRSRAGSTR